MIDVGARKTLDAIDHEVDGALERHLLPLAVMRPELVEPLLATVDRDDAEQILEAAVEQRVALHVEEHVARVGPRQPGQATARLGI